jgi:hypothetical protein
MSLITRNDAPIPWTEQVKLRALDTYAQVVPVARSAGLTCRQGADVVVAWATPRVIGAREWAAPRVHGARMWASPRVEQAGYTVRDKYAPAVSAALIEAAHRLDDSPPKRRRWPWVLAGVAMLAAAGSAAAAIAMKRRPDIETFGSEDQAAAADSATPGIDDVPAQSPGEPARSQANGGAEEEASAANGRMRTH